MRVLRSSFLAIVALAVSPAIGSAQQSEEVWPIAAVVVGSRVRLSTVGGELRGVVAALDEKTLALRGQDGPPIPIPMTSITALDISIRSKRQTLKGLCIAVPIFALIGLTRSVDPNNCGAESGNACSRALAVAGSTLTGAALGAGIGALIKSDRWAPVTLNSPRSDAGPQGTHGFRVAV